MYVYHRTLAHPLAPVFGAALCMLVLFPSASFAATKAVMQVPSPLAAYGPGSQDMLFLRDLGQVSSYVFEGEQLVLNLQSDSGKMIFSPRPPSSLTAGDWRVQGVNN